MTLSLLDVVMVLLRLLYFYYVAFLMILPCTVIAVLCAIWYIVFWYFGPPVYQWTKGKEVAVLNHKPTKVP